MMYPNTECLHDCYKPGDCDGSCTHTDESEKCTQTSDAKFYNGGIAGKTRYVVGETCSDYVLLHPVVAPQQPRAVQPSPRQADAFRNMFAILQNLEDGELGFLTRRQRLELRDNPAITILRLDDARLDALYALITSRQPERYRGIV